MGGRTYETIDYLVGKTITGIDKSSDDEELRFTLSDGNVFRMFHAQDCCERVWLEDVTGAFEAICNSPVLRVYENSNSEDSDWGSRTWTFYTITTFVGSVTLRWCGESNGYYSERVNCEVM